MVNSSPNQLHIIWKFFFEQEIDTLKSFAYRSGSHQFPYILHEVCHLGDQSVNASWIISLSMDQLDAWVFNRDNVDMALRNRNEIFVRFFWHDYKYEKSTKIAESSRG